MTVGTKQSSTKTQPGAPDFNSLDEPIKETFVSVAHNPMRWQRPVNFFSLISASRRSRSRQQVQARSLPKGGQFAAERVGLVGSTRAVYLHGHHPAGLVRWRDTKRRRSRVCRGLCGGLDWRDDRDLQLEAAGRRNFVLPVRVCAWLLPDAAGAGSGRVQCDPETWEHLHVLRDEIRRDGCRIHVGELW
jgi:hypothetical protein